MSMRFIDPRRALTHLLAAALLAGCSAPQPVPPTAAPPTQPPVAATEPAATAPGYPCDASSRGLLRGRIAGLDQEPQASNPSAGAPGASREAIRAHYDAGEDFFALWLGPELVYSAALFQDGDDLATAQIRKLDHHIAAAHAAGAARVLDVGCGWGAMLRRLVRHAGVGQAVGLTLSAAQAAWIGRTPTAGITVREESWRDHVPPAPYDAIISVGAFEHFAQPGMAP